MCKHREANPINRPEISEYRMLGKRHCGATEQSEELYVHNVYYSVLTGIDQSGSPFSSKFLPPSFLSLTLCIFSIFNKVLSVVTTCACAGGGFWYFFFFNQLCIMYMQSYLTLNKFYSPFTITCYIHATGSKKHVGILKIVFNRCRPKTEVFCVWHHK